MGEPVKKCPACGGNLVIRTNRQTGHEFLGCDQWRGEGDGCDWKEKVPESYRMRLAGHPTLPGLS